MIQHILFPTDGSPLGEAAFPAAEILACAQGAPVTVAEVVEPPTWWATDGGMAASLGNGDIYQQTMAALDKAARHHVDRVAERFRLRGISVGTALLHGGAAAQLIECATEIGSDLVIMSTHGRTGLTRFALGSVADRLVREGTIPVFMVRAFGPKIERLERAVVPLDGSTVAEEVLPTVERLARSPLRGVLLLRTLDDGGPQEGAAAYLGSVKVRLEAAGLEVEAAIRHGHAAENIVTAAREADFVIMTTHGRGGYDRLRHGSVAERCVRDLTAPLLLVRAVGGHTDESSSRTKRDAASWRRGHRTRAGIVEQPRRIDD